MSLSLDVPGMQVRLQNDSGGIVSLAARCWQIRSAVQDLYLDTLFGFSLSLGLDSLRVKKLALKLHAHSVHYAHKLGQTRRSLEHSPHLQTNQERSAGLSACNPPDPH